MYSLFRAIGVQEAFRKEFFPFSAAFVSAEVFFKFKSFSLECGAFLATWYVLSLIQAIALRNKR
jgi:hypothetical protein